jgi:hypothetical protein
MDVPEPKKNGCGGVKKYIVRKRKSGSPGCELPDLYEGKEVICRKNYFSM